MPIIISHQDFTQTNDRIFVSVPLHGVRANKADIYANDSYLKINFPPFFYEADLLHLVDTKNSEANVGDGCVKFSLKKSRRLDAVKRELERIEQEKKEKAIKKREEHYKLIQEQLNVEQAEKAQVESLRLQEKLQAEVQLASIIPHLKCFSEQEGIQTWKNQLKNKKTLEDSGIDSTIFVSSKNTADVVNDEDEDYIDMKAIEEKVQKELDKMKIASKPNPRQSGTINFQFTSRGLLPTATARETEDAKWVHRINQAWEKDAKARVDNLYDSLKDDEKNQYVAIFLKDKGNAFFKTGNIQAAINAYTAALMLDKNLTVCFMNRAVCHLKVEDYLACIYDCSAALEILTTEHAYLQERDALTALERQHELNSSKVKLFVRRAAASTKMGNYVDAARDYKIAVELDPKSVDLKEDLQNLEKMILENKFCEM
ncbi:Dynein assembly factor 4, axonemal [Physocladia obscura]|uniref:Dynein assembly factor 4, axonemal n=1 Tax=Physocladia obscura TaxID=109957 RepID=A0AAD5T575_9FUNG|nr:Dynein assembly factor 4, axonemal [Physocladia obscura]